MVRPCCTSCGRTQHRFAASSRRPPRVALCGKCDAAGLTRRVLFSPAERPELDAALDDRVSLVAFAEHGEELPALAPPPGQLVGPGIAAAFEALDLVLPPCRLRAASGGRELQRWIQVPELGLNLSRQELQPSL